MPNLTQQPNIYDEEKDAPRRGSATSGQPKPGGGSSETASSSGSKGNSGTSYYQPPGVGSKHQKPTVAENNELANLPNSSAPQLYRSNGRKKQGTFWVRQRKKIIIGAMAGSFGLGYSGFLFLSGPFQLIHFSQLLQQFHFTNNEDTSDARAGKIIRYLMYPKNPEMRRLGVIGNRNAAKIQTRAEKNGYKFNYDQGAFNRLGSIDLPKGLSEADLQRYRDLGADVDTSRSPPRANLQDSNWGVRRGAIRLAVGDALGLDKVGAAINARNIIRRSGVSFGLFNKVKRGAEESLKSWQQRWRNNRTSEIKDGKTNGGTPRVGSDPVPEEPDPEAKVNAERSRIKQVAKDVGAVTIAVDLVCTIRGLGNEAANIEHETITLRLIRTATRVIVGGNQIMSGEIDNIREVGEESSYLFDKRSDTPAAARSAFGAKSMQSELNQPQTGPDIPEDAKPNGSKNIASRITDPIPLIDETCDLYSNAVTQVFLAPFDPLGYFAGLFLDTTNLLDPLFEGAARLLAREGADPNARGALLGNYANYGARHTANQQAIAAGGRELTTEEVAQLDDDTAEARQQYARSQGWKYRLFDPANPNSALAQTWASITSPNLDTVLQAPAAILKSLKSLPFKISPKAKAANNYDYGFPEYGFSLAELNNQDPSVENPFANEEALFGGKNFEERLADLNQRYGEPCFSVTLNIDGGFTQGSAKPYKDIPGFCKDTTNQELYRFRLYLLDSITLASLACYEGEEALCSAFGIGGSQGGTPTPVSGDVVALAQQILGNPNITYPLDASSPNGSSKEIMQTLAEGKKAFTTCPGRERAETDVNPNILKFLIEAGQQTKVGVNALTDKCHSNNSKHYSGEAVDLDLQSGPLSILAPIANKYGGTKNSETTHHHFDFPKSP